MLGQDDNERIMGQKLRSHGVDVQWNTELVALQQNSDGVEVSLRQPDGSTRTLVAGWVAGCDGSRSAVRELNGITFPGAPYEHAFFVADTQATGSMMPRELNVYLWQDGFHLFFPMRGEDRWRVIGILPAGMRGRNDLTFNELVPALQQEAGANLVFKQCSWFSTYRIHHRAAERFRDRRCFLLGDAAHVHSPMGAQGMNTGLQDAYNLAWKLALVVKGRGETDLLDSYEQERVPVAKRLLSTTDRAFQLVVSDSWLAGLFRTRIIARVAARAMTNERVRKLAFRTISQIGIRYPDSSLSENLGRMRVGAPRAGDRFPWMQLRLQSGAAPQNLFDALDDRCFNLIVFGTPEHRADVAAHTDLVRVHVIPANPFNRAELARAQIPEPSSYLLRPDGHVGLCGPCLENSAITRYLSGRVHMLRVSRPPVAFGVKMGAPFVAQSECEQ
jgi:2-polyprenyl-6-methoxyphenol hydroxylase-like FAD-dependent oxidoreductase